VTIPTISDTIPAFGAAPIASHAPPGASASATPSHACAPHVKRLASEYPRSTASTTGERTAGQKPSVEARPTKSPR